MDRPLHASYSGHIGRSGSRPRSAQGVRMKSRLSRRHVVIGLCATSALWPLASPARCANPPEGGRWRNLNATGEPAFLDVRMSSCGDQVLNGQQTSTNYKLKVWVRQSSGQFYGRPVVDAGYRNWNG